MHPKSLFNFCGVYHFATFFIFYVILFREKS